MSTTRLTFLYPHLFRSLRAGESTAIRTAKTRCRKPADHLREAAATFSISARTKEAVFERHGKAVEPKVSTPEIIKLPEPKSQPQPQPKSQPDPQAENSKKESADSKQRKDATVLERPAGEKKDSGLTKGEDVKKVEIGPQEGSGTIAGTTPNPQQKAAEEKMQSSGPMDAILHMPPPAETFHPHIATPPYVHHFDSYTLVKQLEDGGYSKAQAITVMKAVRALLAQNLDVAQDGLVSKSDVDNETYLFGAACSELSTEVANNRKKGDEETRAKRTLLQHELDILSQKLSQDLMTLRDDVKGMFNDRKMAVREEQRRMEGALQQVNLDISVTLTSDAKSDIEGLRWVLIRRSVTGILIMAVLTLGSIRYATYVNHEKKKIEDEKAREAENMRRSSGREDKAPAHDAAEILAAN